MGDTTNQFVILPRRGLRSRDSTPQREFLLEAESARRAGGRMELKTPGQMMQHLASLGLSAMSSSLASVGLLGPGPTSLAVPAPNVRVLDSLHEDGAKLAELNPQAIAALRQIQPGLRVLPVLSYGLAKAPEQYILQQAAEASLAAGAPAAWTLTITDSATGSPIPDVRVVAFTDYAARSGTESRTDLAGQCRLSLSSSAVVERLYVYPRPTHWGALERGVAAHGISQIALQPVALSQADLLQEYSATLPAPSLGKGVKVGVVDSGVDLTHPDLTVRGGKNTVLGESESDYGDNGQGHGTHVAGIIAGRTPRGAGTIGLAPEAELLSFRPFATGAGTATNFNIAKAIDAATGAGCDIINMSFAQPTRDDVINDAVQDAYEAGVLLVAAAGNDGRKPVGFPAALDNVAAVSALGRKGTFPASSVESGEVDTPFGADPDHFIARFSNFGPEIDLTAPGVGVISTFPSATFGAMSGTSMAAPVVAGYAARLLGAQTQILNMPRNSARADALLQLLFAAALSLGFTASFEGRGGPK